MSILFLDIDGVLNSTHGCVNTIAKIFPECMYNLNWIIRHTNVNVVISSPWRSAIHDGDMTLSGFTRLLKTHGFVDVVFDYIGPDIENMTQTENRAVLINKYLDKHGVPYIVLDDEPLSVENLIKIDGLVGLTAYNARDAIKSLREQNRAYRQKQYERGEGEYTND